MGAHLLRLSQAVYTIIQHHGLTRLDSAPLEHSTIVFAPLLGAIDEVGAEEAVEQLIDSRAMKRSRKIAGLVRRGQVQSHTLPMQFRQHFSRGWIEGFTPTCMRRLALNLQRQLARIDIGRECSPD